jgi:hypothetical protein
VPTADPDPTELLLRRRLAAQRLSSGCAADDPVAAVRAVLGVQAQDVRAAGLAIRSRVPGVTRADVDAAPLVRTWTVRGTAHLIAADDLPWIDALTGPRNRRRFDALMVKRENLGVARALLEPAIDILAAGPMTRAALIERLDERGLPSLGEYSINVLMPWLASSGRVIGRADGTFAATDPPPPVDEDEALATLARRYLAGYGPASAADLARWSGLPITACRRAFEAAGPLESVGELAARPDRIGPPPPAPAAKLLGAFDTALLGWVGREPIVPAAHDRRIGGGGGMIRAVVLIDGRAVATWKLTGSGSRRRLLIDPFDRPPPPAAVAALGPELDDVGRFLGLAVEPAS